MKYIYTPIRLVAIILISVFGIATAHTCNGQDFTFDQTSGAKGQTIQIILSSSNITFQQATATICPSSVKVNAASVKFTSGTTAFSPSSIVVSSGSITATVTIPINAVTGKYAVSVSGVEGNCKVISTTNFTVKSAYTTVTPQSDYVGNIVTLTIEGFGVSFQNSSPSTCPNLLQATDSTLMLKQGTTIILPNFISVTSSKITGDFAIPANAPLGNYDLIIDYKGACPFISTAAFKVLPRSATITPDTVNLGTTTQVTFAGNGVTFDDVYPSYCPDLVHVSSTTVYFQQGSTILYPDNLTIDSYGQIIINVTIPNNQLAGSYDVYIGNDQTCGIVQSKGFTIQAPTITSISPAQALRGATFTMDIHAAGVTFDGTAASVCPGLLNVTTTNIYLKQGTAVIYPNSIISAGQELIKADFTVPGNASYGNYDLVVGDGEGCTLTLTSGFSVPAPGITSITPSNANPGQVTNVSINTNGANFTNSPPSICPSSLYVTASNITFKLGTTTIHPSSITITGNKIDITVTFPQNATIGSYDVIVGDGETCSLTAAAAFTVNKPNITVSPNSAYVNDNLLVTITGASVSFTQSAATVCPNLLRITNADVSFVQGVNIIHPSSTLVSGNTIKAYMNLPSYTVPGYYDVVLGANSACPVTLAKGFYVASPSATISPDTASTNETLDITITGVDVNFTETSSTACPSLVNVTKSNITFKQGTAVLSPTSITVTSNTIVAHVVVPSNFALGYKTLTIGVGETCPVVVSNALLIQNPRITSSVSKIDQSTGQEIIITGHGLSFTQSSTTSCPSSVNISTNDIVLKNGTTSIHPQSATLVNGTIQCIFNTTGSPAATYTLVVGDVQACLYSTSVDVGVVAGVKTASSKEDIIDIYPNPTDGTQLYLNIKRNGNYTISILDPYGKEISSFNQSGSGISSLQEMLKNKIQSGIYYLKVSDGEQFYVEKIIIE